ncbi:amidohydrolase family protein [Nocardia blacklockiae]|uniref:amidohydrolase family protein n=1 Tax=Nocardia blacklockiae TaxID=480036 RepID=UPI0018950B10|nr:amidohydrolase family protein [Nocardia blacklockiae]MBF6170001.1 amidohydrolase family protein [Nocardia blacklockiae]
MVGESDIDARGGWLLPGLHDHHTHLRATAALARSVRLDEPPVRDLTQLVERLRLADRDLPAGNWIRAVGYHEPPDRMLDRAALDKVSTDRAIRVQHRSGALWVLNSRACELLGVDACPLPGVERDATGRATGRLWRMDAWLAAKLDMVRPDPAAVSTCAAARGITGFTDATPGLAQNEVDRFARQVAERRILQRMHCMAPPEVADPATPRFTLGPTKFLLDDDSLPPLDEFTAAIRTAHEAGRSVAVHCVTRVQLFLTMAALEDAGLRQGDRIEHGAIIPADALPWLRKHGVPVITQPHFPIERAEQYAREVPADEHKDLWRLRSLLEAGITVAAGTDAPFGGADPWDVIRAAVQRPPNPTVAECVSLPEAIALFTAHAHCPARQRTIEPGAVADLTLLHTPPSEVIDTPTPELVAATVVDGEPVHLAEA